MQNSREQFAVHSLQFVVRIKNVLTDNRGLSTVNLHSLFTIPFVHANIPLQPPLPRFKPWPSRNPLKDLTTEATEFTEKMPSVLL